MSYLNHWGPAVGLLLPGSAAQCPPTQRTQSASPSYGLSASLPLAGPGGFRSPPPPPGSTILRANLEVPPRRPFFDSCGPLHTVGTCSYTQ